MWGERIMTFIRIKGALKNFPKSKIGRCLILLVYSFFILGLTLYALWRFMSSFVPFYHIQYDYPFVTLLIFMVIWLVLPLHPGNEFVEKLIDKYGKYKNETDSKHAEISNDLRDNINDIQDAQDNDKIEAE